MLTFSIFLKKMVISFIIIISKYKYFFHLQKYDVFKQCSLLLSHLHQNGYLEAWIEEEESHFSKSRSSIDITQFIYQEETIIEKRNLYEDLYYSPVKTRVR